MDLLAYQRAFMRMSFAREPAPEDVALLGNQAAALLYRHMIRTRLEGMAKVAFKLSVELLGEGAFAACFARYLAAAPPKSPLIREVIAEFGPFAQSDAAVHAAGPACLADLLRFEEAKWRLAYAPAPSVDRASLRELDFAGAPVWNPLLRLLSLAYPVHTATTAGGSGAQLARDACALFMYRPPGSDEVRWYKADPFFAALVRHAQARARASFGELIPVVARECGSAVDQELLESLATSLTLALERGVLLGVLDRS
jgi:hypothetical protein